ncbi:MAG: hypothetical protein AAF268_14035 [Cyanobacteria bacterium P01_A01_bin.3]
MSPVLTVAIVAAHLSVYLVSALNIWIFSRRSEFYRTVLPLRSLPLIYCGFACFAIASSYEIAEHIGDNWIYVSQISALNRLFYTFITAGVGLIAMGLKKALWTDILAIACIIAVPLAYGVNGEKGPLLQIPQLIVAALFVYHWFITMRDWRVFLYPVLSNGVALGFGIALIATGNQVLHIFVGLFSAIALLILGYIAWEKPLTLSSPD